MSHVLKYPFAYNFLKWFCENLRENKIKYTHIDTGCDYFAIYIGSENATFQDIGSSILMDWKHFEPNHIKLFNTGIRPFGYCINYTESEIGEISVRFEKLRLAQACPI